VEWEQYFGEKPYRKVCPDYPTLGDAEETIQTQNWLAVKARAVAEVSSQFVAALQINPKLEINFDDNSEWVHVHGQMQEAMAFAQAGNMQAVQDILRNIREQNPEYELLANELHALCLYGVLADHATSVIGICQQAVMKSEDVAMLSGRGMDRAMIGNDLIGAVEDFARYQAEVRQQGGDPEVISMLERWILLLQSNVNPVQAFVYLRNGKVNEALAIYEQLDWATLSTFELANLCYYGAVSGYARQVQHGCELIPEYYLEQPDARLGRAIVRAFSGNIDGSVTDFGFLVEQNFESELLQPYLQRLKDGEDPSSVLNEDALSALNAN